jgi:hypothetical protein
VIALPVRVIGIGRNGRSAWPEYAGEFLVALADFDRRRLWLELGHSSLFYFLHRELGLSKGAAFYRCVFRPEPIADSGASRSLIPVEADHRFRSKPIAERISR